MGLREILSDIHALEEELLAFERKFGVRRKRSMPHTWAGKAGGRRVGLGFRGVGASARTWLARQADYRNGATPARWYRACRLIMWPDERSSAVLVDSEHFVPLIAVSGSATLHGATSRRGATLARIAGGLQFDLGLRLVIRQRL
jgi:hypothetical protein